MTDRTIFRMLWITLAFVAVLFAVMLTLSPETQKTILREGGGVETASALVYVAGLIALLIRPRLAVWPFAVMTAFFAAREFDLDKSLFTRGLLKSRQYSADDVPGMEKLISALLLCAILAAGIWLLIRYTRPFLRGLRSGSATAFVALAAIVLAVSTKTLDGIARKLEPFGIPVSDSAANTFYVYEEVGELGMALCVCILCLLWARAASSRTPHPNSPLTGVIE